MNLTARIALNLTLLFAAIYIITSLFTGVFIISEWPGAAKGCFLFLYTWLGLSLAILTYGES